MARWAEARPPSGYRYWPGQGGTRLHPQPGCLYGDLTLPSHSLYNTVTPFVSSPHHPNTPQADLISSLSRLNGARRGEGVSPSSHSYNMVVERLNVQPIQSACSKSCALLSRDGGRFAWRTSLVFRSFGDEGPGSPESLGLA